MQGGLGEAGHLLLGAGTVLQHEVGVGDINLLGKIIDHLFLRFGERAVVDDRFGDGLGGRRGSGGRGLGYCAGKGIEGQCGCGDFSSRCRGLKILRNFKGRGLGFVCHGNPP